MFRNVSNVWIIIFNTNGDYILEQSGGRWPGLDGFLCVMRGGEFTLQRSTRSLQQAKREERGGPLFSKSIVQYNEIRKCCLRKREKLNFWKSKTEYSSTIAISKWSFRPKWEWESLVGGVPCFWGLVILVGLQSVFACCVHAAWSPTRYPPNEHSS